MINAAIIDDEFHGINALSRLLQKHCPEINLLFTTQQPEEASHLLNQHQPDLVFLDIDMPRLNGIALLQQLSNIPFKVIFTTAYDQYAIQAIRMNALDYLLKPIDKTELRNAVDQYLQFQQHTSPVQVASLQRMQQGHTIDTLAVTTGQGLSFVKLEEIVVLEAISCYTQIVLQDGKKLLVSKTLALFEETLQHQPQFFRAHKSYMVNVKAVVQYIRGEGGELLLRNGMRIALSRQKKQEFLALFTKI
ncbi:LytR/AlgR family response regulator transcription factor [Phnomibacter ginsenosidimutans]|uniref:Response regulator n=1 Tax=Phnomibacter ginsenosidimutans TaxID=2676868 RepID=A0A6I6GGI4_9BACT|nr:LytTR family DNA-binding domain-containing protein [Phnomibacter ginsenosidimutans]QGW29500.1 response regulator [Phnomibacter ginsenosidimutans]